MKYGKDGGYLEKLCILIANDMEVLLRILLQHKGGWWLMSLGQSVSCSSVCLLACQLISGLRRCLL